MKRVETFLRINFQRGSGRLKRDGEVRSIDEKGIAFGSWKSRRRRLGCVIVILEMRRRRSRGRRKLRSPLGVDKETFDELTDG